jgi:hypothetical protein
MDSAGSVEQHEVGRPATTTIREDSTDMTDILATERERMSPAGGETAVTASFLEIAVRTR